MIDILEGKGYLQKVFDMEREKGTDAILAYKEHIKAYPEK